MLFLSKHCFRGQIRNGCDRLFSKFLLRRECSIWKPKILRSCKDYVPRENVWKCNMSRALSTEKGIEPLNMAFLTETRKTFAKFLPNVMKDLTEDETYSDIPEARKRFFDVLLYNLPNGCFATGFLILTSYKMLEKQENLTEENIRLGTSLAWCGELLAATIFLADDIMDNSETRENAECWFKIEGVGLTAINDVLFLKNSTFFLLKKYFSFHPTYMPIKEYLHDVFRSVIYGQCIDTIKPKIEEITLERFNRIAKYKAGCVMPTILGMYLTDTYSAELHRNIEPILLQLGIYLQIWNDMADCFGDAKTTGKIGTDIQEGKCTWPASIALQKANPVQRKLMKDYYGNPEKKESVEIIRNLYEELNIPAEYAAYKEKSFKKICSQISDVAANDAMRALLFTHVELFFNHDILKLTRFSDTSLF